MRKLCMLYYHFQFGADYKIAHIFQIIWSPTPADVDLANGWLPIRELTNVGECHFVLLAGGSPQTVHGRHGDDVRPADL